MRSESRSLKCSEYLNNKNRISICFISLENSNNKRQHQVKKKKSLFSKIQRSEEETHNSSLQGKRLNLFLIQRARATRWQCYCSPLIDQAEISSERSNSTTLRSDRAYSCFDRPGEALIIVSNFLYL